jgi:hypothetical protein
LNPNSGSSGFSLLFSKYVSAATGFLYLSIPLSVGLAQFPHNGSERIDGKTSTTKAKSQPVDAAICRNHEMMKWE